MTQREREKRTLEIGYFITEKGGHRINTEAAIAAAQERFGDGKKKISRAAIYKEWGSFLNIFKSSISSNGGDPEDRELVNQRIDEWRVFAKVQMKKQDLNL